MYVKPGTGTATQHTVPAREELSLVGERDVKFLIFYFILFLFFKNLI